MAYFDNAATTFPKPEEVYSFMDEYYRTNGGSAGRGKYALANSASGLVEETRGLICDLLNCPGKQVVFEPTATVSLNIVLQGLILGGAKNIYISPFEHNAVTRVLHNFIESGLISVEQLAVKSNSEYDFERIAFQFDDKNPDLLVVSHASNVTGVVAPIERIFPLAKKHDAKTVLDMSQTAGLIDTNVNADYIDAAIFAGHKTLYGPTGLSGFVIDPGVSLVPILFGGTGVDSANQSMPQDLPARFEMGTVNTMGVAGLNAATKWILKMGINEIAKKEKQNRDSLINVLNDYSFISVVGNNDNLNYVGVVSTLFQGVSSDVVGGLLDRMGISVRSGLQCAPYAHHFLGTYPAGTVRFSVSYFTKDEDFEELRNALDEIEREL